MHTCFCVCPSISSFSFSFSVFFFALCYYPQRSGPNNSLTIFVSVLLLHLESSCTLWRYPSNYLFIAFTFFRKYNTYFFLYKFWPVPNTHPFHYLHLNMSLNIYHKNEPFSTCTCILLEELSWFTCALRLLH